MRDRKPRISPSTTEGSLDSIKVEPQTQPVTPSASKAAQQTDHRDWMSSSSKIMKNWTMSGKTMVAGVGQDGSVLTQNYTGKGKARVADASPSLRNSFKVRVVDSQTDRQGVEAIQARFQAQVDRHEEKQEVEDPDFTDSSPPPRKRHRSEGADLTRPSGHKAPSNHHSRSFELSSENTQVKRVKLITRIEANWKVPYTDWIPRAYLPSRRPRHGQTEPQLLDPRDWSTTLLERLVTLSDFLPDKPLRAAELVEEAMQYPYRIGKGPAVLSSDIQRAIDEYKNAGEETEEEDQIEEEERFSQPDQAPRMPGDDGDINFDQTDEAPANVQASRSMQGTTPVSETANVDAEAEAGVRSELVNDIPIRQPTVQSDDADEQGDQLLHIFTPTPPPSAAAREQAEPEEEIKVEEHTVDGLQNDIDHEEDEEELKSSIRELEVLREAKLLEYEILQRKRKLREAQARRNHQGGDRSGTVTTAVVSLEGARGAGDEAPIVAGPSGQARTGSRTR